MAGTSQHLRLARTARLAGEAFAFNEPEQVSPAVRRLPIGGLALTFVALAAATALYLGF
ncbi:MAG TPA: hypothetical protein VIL09_15970 [Microvirga sp.]|jgi:hypothetical protein